MTEIEKDFKKFCYECCPLAIFVNGKHRCLVRRCRYKQDDSIQLTIEGLPIFKQFQNEKDKGEINL